MCSSILDDIGQGREGRVGDSRWDRDREGKRPIAGVVRGAFKDVMRELLAV